MRKMFAGKNFLIAMVLIAILLSSVGCMTKVSQEETIAPEVDSFTEATEKRYSEIEIRDYQGIRLDPSVGPRDNSISGIQQVDLQSYKLKISGLVEIPVDYSYDEIIEKESFQRLITLYCVEGWDATILWEGIRIMSLLNDAIVL